MTGKRKALILFCVLWPQLRDLPVKLLVVGSDEPALYRPDIDRLALQSVVRFERPSSNVLSFYAAADLYVGPSLEDSFGLPVLEAMACGLPVIASSNSGVSELIQHGETGFVLRNVQDETELASLIRRLQTEDELRLTIGLAASHYVAANCSWDDNTEKVRQFLENVRNHRNV